MGHHPETSMARPKAALPLLIDSIRSSLDELAAQGEVLAIATWPDADSGGGYLIDMQGRMAGAEDYQYGFSTLDELLSADLSEEVQRYARSEAGAIAGNIVGLSSDPDLREQASAYMPYNFGVSASLVEAALESGRLTLEDAFTLFISAPQDAYVVHDANAVPGKDTVVLAQDVSVATLVEDPAGSLVWKDQVVARVGESVPAEISAAVTTATLPCGRLMLKPAAIESASPGVRPSRRCGP
jgi:hypothetical protein